MFGEQFSLLSLGGLSSRSRSLFFFSSITIQLRLCTAPVQTAALDLTLSASVCNHGYGGQVRFNDGGEQFVL